MKSYGEECMLKKRMLLFILVLSLVVLTACSNQKNESTENKKQITGEFDSRVLSYLGMSYQDFRDNGGEVAEHNHGGRYMSVLADTDLKFVFFGNYDEEKGEYTLAEDNPCIRVQGDMGSIIIGIQEITTVEQLIENLKNSYTIEYTYEEGETTAYYVADKFLRVNCDVNHDDKIDVILDVSLSNAKLINTETYCWIMLTENH